MNDEEEIRLLQEQRKLPNEKIKLGDNQKAEKCIFKCRNLRTTQWI